jgi:hypothetical protein
VRAHGANNRRDSPIGGGIARTLGREERLHRAPIGRLNDPHHLLTTNHEPRTTNHEPRTRTYTTILFSGYSTMPWPPAAFTFGIRSRTVRSSMIVLTATHSSSLSDEIVGR